MADTLLHTEPSVEFLSSTYLGAPALLGELDSHSVDGEMLMGVRPHVERCAL